MGKKQKYYVVWHGAEPGIYRSWEECERQVKGFANAKYKSFGTEAEANEAFADPDYQLGDHNVDEIFPKPLDVVKAIKEGDEETISMAASRGLILNAMAVDAACSGNPGKMEYQGVYVATGQRIFHFGPMYGTNNIGEFLAIVHALALMKKQGYSLPIYSDSRNAMSWVKQKKCRTMLERNAKTEQLFQLIERAEKWLRENTYDVPILKWDKQLWGETPADFGRK
ncbi:MAG: ribonuclease H family protein [Bacteroidaceae bacterium]|nr:ribonuclease H family protein [Bacteroidaceae bacterium]MBR1541795.1 ribonuclease H family protein [Bacteroidaceae bacterium]